jgi:glycosidase
MLRPALDLPTLRHEQPNDLPAALTRLAALRKASPALRRGDYRQLAVGKEHLAFLRRAEGESVVVVVNGGTSPVNVNLEAPGARLVERLNAPLTVPVRQGRARFTVPSRWARVLRVEG